MSKSIEKGYIRTESDWLRITLVDTMFNKIFFCLRKYHYQMSNMVSQLNNFYDPETDIGSVVYDSEYKVKGGYMVSATKWNKALLVRRSLYIYLRDNIDNAPKIIRQYLLKYMLGIHDIMSQLLIK